jgi:hypothetical protein
MFFIQCLSHNHGSAAVDTIYAQPLAKECFYVDTTLDVDWLAGLCGCWRDGDAGLCGV